MLVQPLIATEFSISDLPHWPLLRDKTHLVPNS